MSLKIDAPASRRLLLEKRVAAHAEEVFELFCEPDLYTFTMRNIAESKEWLAHGFKKAESMSSPDGKEIWLGWIAKERTTLKPIGLFELTIIERQAFVAYTIFKPFWGQGYAIEGTKAMMALARENHKIDRFIIEMDTRNRASMKVAERLGSEFVRVKNNAAFLKNFVSHEFEFQKLD